MPKSKIYKPSSFAKVQSFSGCDIIPIIYGEYPFKVTLATKKEYHGFLPGIFNIGMLTTLSYSGHTDKRPITPCGQRKPKGFTSGMQTFAGTMIFTVMNDHPLAGMLGDDLNNVITATNDISLIPPFDLTLIIANEAGNRSVLNIFGIEFIDEGFTTSVNDIYSELTTQYLCRDVSMIKSISPDEMNEIYLASVGSGNEYMRIV